MMQKIRELQRWDWQARDSVEMEASTKEHYPQAANPANPGEINAFQVNWQKGRLSGVVLQFSCH